MIKRLVKEVTRVRRSGERERERIDYDSTNEITWINGLDGLEFGK